MGAGQNQEPDQQNTANQVDSDEDVEEEAPILSDPPSQDQHPRTDRFLRYDPDAKLNSELLATVATFRQVLDQVERWVQAEAHGHYEHRRTLNHSLRCSQDVARAALGLLARPTAGELGSISLGAFIPQRSNFGAPESLITTEVARLSNIELNGANGTSKRTRVDADNEVVTQSSFAQFCAALKADESFALRARGNMLSSEVEDFRPLRANLEKNTKARLFAISQLIIQVQTIAKTSKKTRIVDAILNFIKEKLNEHGRVSDGFSEKIGDFGVVRQNVGDELRAGDLILLTVNSSDALGDDCTQACDCMGGWVVGPSAVREVEISSSILRWGKLSEKRKDIDDLQLSELNN